MTYMDGWRAIAARLKGLECAATINCSLVAADQKYHGNPGGEFLLDLRNNIERCINDYYSNNKQSLPALASGYLKNFLEKLNAGGPIEHNKKIVMLIALESEMSYLLANTEEEIRSRAELAFLHLQSLLYVDPAAQKLWQEAFESHETHCERPGKVHFLHHGILAYKLDGGGVRTDLMFQDQCPDSRLFRSVAGLVLTEWKRATDLSKADAMLNESRNQAARYSDVPLAGLELRSVRYAVVVTKEPIANGPIQVRPDEKGDGCIYRFINIAVKPSHISAQARRRTKKKPTPGKLVPHG